MIGEHWDRLKAILDRYAAAPFVADATYTFQLRPGGQGYLQGTITFIDRSALHFSEFLDTTSSSIERLMYTYHYRSAEDVLIFRYDNARHRPPLASEHHKHTVDGVVPSNAPELSDVLAEIVLSKGWLT